ncbi:MAG: hypothetical protein JW785_01495 [Acidimicrobiia bacterium]|nr:hypothetical protein [Acidimicrobiia bacterium]
MTPFIVSGILADVAGAALVVAGAVTGNPALLAPGIPLLIAGTVFWLVGAKTGALTGGTSLRSLLRGAAAIPEGLPARALVRAIGETGWTINEAPAFSFDLEVHREGQPPYPVTVKQMVPRMLVGAVLPDHEVSVRVDPADASRVAIDWSEMPRAAGATETDDPPALLAAIPPERRGSAADLLARGRRGTARLLGIRDLGDAVEAGLMTATDPRAGARLALLELEVKLPGRDPYQAKVVHWLPADLVGRVGPGRQLAVAVDRDDPEHEVAVDWEAAPE